MHWLSAQCSSSIGWIVKSVCVSALQIAILSRSSLNWPPRQSPAKCGYLLFLAEIRKTPVHQTGSGINFHHCSLGKIALMSNISKMLTRYYNGVNGSRLWNHPWAVDWHRDLWPWITFNCPSSRSLNLHVKYFRNGDRCDVALGRYTFHRMYVRSIEHISCLFNSSISSLLVPVVCIQCCV